MSSWRDPAFHYHGAASHANGDAFRRRQRERIRAAEAERKAREAVAQEQAAKVRRIAGGTK